jgi:hypothetical protein
MKFFLLVVAAVIMTTATVNAQDNVKKSSGTKFGIAANAGFSTVDVYKFVYGADVQADFPATSSLKITASLGYEIYHWKIPGSSFTGNTAQIPILAGVKYLLSTNLYAHGQIGYSVKGNAGDPFLMPNGNGFAFALSGGYIMGNLDLGIKYLATHPGGSDLGGIVARVAYNLGGK